MIINGIEVGTSGTASAGTSGTSGITQLDIDGGNPSTTYGGTITLDGGGV